LMDPHLFLPSFPFRGSLPWFDEVASNRLGGTSKVFPLPPPFPPSCPLPLSTLRRWNRPKSCPPPPVPFPPFFFPLPDLPFLPMDPEGGEVLALGCGVCFPELLFFFPLGGSVKRVAQSAKNLLRIGAPLPPSFLFFFFYGDDKL